MIRVCVCVYVHACARMCRVEKGQHLPWHEHGGQRTTWCVRWSHFHLLWDKVCCYHCVHQAYSTGYEPTLLCPVFCGFLRWTLRSSLAGSKQSVTKPLPQPLFAVLRVGLAPYLRLTSNSQSPCLSWVLRLQTCSTRPHPVFLTYNQVASKQVWCRGLMISDWINR